MNAVVGNRNIVLRLSVLLSLFLAMVVEAQAREGATPPRQAAAKTKTQNAPAAPADAASPRIPVVPMEDFAGEPADDPPPDSSGKPEEPSACQFRIADRIAVVEPLPTFGGPGDCGATDVVRLVAVIQQDSARIAITPPATLRCTMAEAIAHWVRDDLTTAAATLGSPLRTLDNYASYDCRGRNRLAGARISEHGLANAIDVRGVTLANGKFVGFTDRTLDRGYRETIRKSVCARFTTVLGPGSDGHHETHVHLDLAERRGGYRLCQWAVLDPPEAIPLPRPRPPEAP